MKMNRIAWHAISQISGWLRNIRDEKWSRDREISAQICLRTYLWRDEERERELAGCSTSENQHSAVKRAEEAAIRLIVSHSVRFSAVTDRKTIREQGAIADSARHELLKWRWNAKDKKKVQLKDVDCKGFCCYSAKGKRYGGASIESPKQVGMFRVSPPH